MADQRSFFSTQPSEDEELDPLTRLLNKLRGKPTSRQQALARTYEQSSLNRQPPQSPFIVRRRKGLWGINQQDQAAYDAAKWNEELAYLIARLTTNTAKIAAHNFDVSATADEQLQWRLEGMPEELREDAKALAYFLSEVVASESLESAKMYAELAHRKIAKLEQDNQ